MIEIKIENAVWSRVMPAWVPRISPCLSYESFTWQYNFKLRRKVQKKYTKSLVQPDGVFNTGLLPRLTDWLDAQGIPYKITGEQERVVPKQPPQIRPFEGFKGFHDHQIYLIDAALRYQRGCLVAATATGKTLTAAGLMSCFPDGRFLFIVNNKTLAQQAYNDFSRYGFTGLQLLYEGEKHVTGKIVVATRQSYILLDMHRYSTYFDGVIVDEVHHTPDAYAENLQITNHILAPIRIGLSATYPSDLQQQISIEAALGPVIGEFTIEEAVEGGIISKPSVKLYKTEYHDNIRVLHRWNDVERRGIVENLSRNRQIMRITKGYIAQGLSVLILIRVIDHGENLMQIAAKMGLPVQFVHGKTEGDMREQLRSAMNRKEVKCIIASTVWKEGVDIPTLDVVVIADGGMKESATIQKIGRGLRKTGDKDHVLIVDFFDPSNEYLIKHFGHRVSLYFDKGWL